MIPTHGEIALNEGKKHGSTYIIVEKELKLEDLKKFKSLLKENEVLRCFVSEGELSYPGTGWQLEKYIVDNGGILSSYDYLNYSHRAKGVNPIYHVVEIKG